MRSGAGVFLKISSKLAWWLVRISWLCGPFLPSRCVTFLSDHNASGITGLLIQPGSLNRAIYQGYFCTGAHSTGLLLFTGAPLYPGLINWGSSFDSAPQSTGLFFNSTGLFQIPLSTALLFIYYWVGGGGTIGSSQQCILQCPGSASAQTVLPKQAQKK